MGLGSVLTGLSIYKPIQFHSLCSLLGGYEWARAEHFILTILFVLFFVVHVVQVILAGWNNFRSMVTGLDVLRPGKVNVLQPVVIHKEMVSNQFTAPEKKIPEPEAAPKEKQPNEVILEEEKPPSETTETNKETGANVLPPGKNSTPESDEITGK